MAQVAALALIGGSGIAQAISAKKAGDLNARMIELEGKSAASRQRRKDERAISRATALAAASGVAIDEGSPILREAVDTMVMEQNQANIEFNTKVRAQLAKQQGNQAAFGTLLKTGGSLLVAKNAFD